MRRSVRSVSVILPAALLLSLFAPWLITPLLMIGGAYLCYEGAEKVFHALAPHDAEKHEAGLEPVAIAPQSLEDQKVAGAIEASVTPQNADPDIIYYDDAEGDVLYQDPELSFKTKLADLPLIIQEMIYKEERILFPEALNRLSESE